MKRACLLLLPAVMLVLAASGCNDESKPSFTRVRVTPLCGVAPVDVEGYAIVSGGDESGEPLGGNNNLEINWSFGDGGTGRTSLAYHKYTDPGDYQITVVAKDPQGNTASSELMVSVMTDSMLINAISLNFPDGVATTADIIQFSFEAESCDIDFPTVMGDSVKVEILWEMNDPGNHVYTIAEPLFRFDTADTYDVDLTLTYPAWAVTRKSQIQITVNP